MKLYNNKKGMTLIEVIVAMAIFGIMLIGFLAMFSSSLIRIYDAADKGEAYSTAQKDVENRLASKDSLESNSITITFDGTDYIIDGGTVESTHVVNRKESTLTTFVPLLPTITLEPSIRYEGDKENTIIIKGDRTNFNDNTIVEVYDYTGNNKLYVFTPDLVNKNEQTIIVSLKVGGNPVNLANGDYIVRTKTVISGKSDELSRAKYVVQQPKYIVVGGTDVYISANGKEWVDRNNFPNIPTGITGLKSVDSNSAYYLAVGAEGKVLRSIENDEWSYLGYSSSDLTDVTYSVEFGKFYIAESSGKISSLDAYNNWNIYSSNTNELNKIESTRLPNSVEMLFAVGDGIILTSTDGISWVNVSGSNEYNFKSVSSGLNKTIVVGTKKAEPYDGLTAVFDHITMNWSFNSTGQVILNDIDYISGKSSFIGVGDDGKVFTTHDYGATWSHLNLGFSNKLNGVYTSSSNILICGEEGLILFSDDFGASWIRGILYDAKWDAITMTGDLKSLSGK